MARDPGLTGVGGWLLFFCLNYLVLRPLAIMPYMRYYRIDSPYTYFVLAETAFGMIVALLLWMRRSEVLSYVRVLLLLEVVLISTRIIRLFGRVQPTPARDVLVLMFCGIGLIPFAWYAYFNRSVRVRNTYGRNL